MTYINETDFVINNKELVYPEIVTDGLQLYYDAKGKRDTDYHRDTMLDMSGNKNHGKLYNFAYEKHSGYKDGLVFDYVDDKLVRPALDLNPNDFTFMLNGNIISFSPDGTVKRVQDGEVIESKGFNMLYELEKNSQYGLDVKYSYNRAEAKWLPDITTNTFLYSTSKYIFEDRHKYYISYNAKPDGPVNLRIYANQRYLDDDITDPVLNEYNFRSGIIEAESRYYNIFNVRLSFNINNAVPDTVVTVKDLMMIDLTETFGAGNEPTKEQMDEIINRFGFIPNAQDLIDRIEYKGNDLGDMENIIDGLYKTDVLSGEEIYTDKADDDAVVHVEVDGKSVGGGSGKNLVELILLYQYSPIRVRYPLDKLKADVPYYVSLKNKDYTFWNGGGWVSEGPINDNIRSTGVSIRRGTEASGAGEQHTVGEFIKEGLFQIEEGSTATAYEPPAPTPDYPIEIHSLNDFDVVSSVGKENIILKSDYIPFTQGVEEAYKGHLCTKIASSTSTNSTPGNINFSEESVAGSWYTYSVLVAYQGTKPSSIQLYLNGFHSYRTAEGFDSLDEGVFGRIYVTSQAYNNSTVARPHLHIRGGDGHVYFTKWKLEKSNVATNWVPALEDIVGNDNHPLIDKNNLLLDEPLRSVGDVKDRLFRDTDGVWKVERNVGKDVFDGTESGWKIYPDIQPDALGFYHGGKSQYVPHKAISSHFNIVPDLGSGGAHVLNDEGYSHTTNNAKFSIYKHRLKSYDIAGVRDWLSGEYLKGTPVITTYVLKESYIEPLPQSLQDKLNNLRSFKDSNYIYTVLPDKNNTFSENLKPTLHAKFLYNNWYKEDRVINNLMIYNRALTNEEMLQNYKTIKRRWGM